MNNGHGIVAETLHRLGVSHVYGIPGTPVDETLSACVRADIRVLGTRHQQAACLMSAAHNYAAGRLTSAVVVSAGPAVTNTATGILVARDNAWPLLVLGGRRPLALRALGSFQELDGAAALAALTKHASVVDRPGRLGTALAEAYEIATVGRPGPVYLDLPEDVLAACCRPPTAVAPAERLQPAPTADSLADAVCLLTRARRPLLVFGKGLRWSEPWAALHKLADDHRMPFIASPMARGFLPDDHPQNYSAIQSFALRSADVLLVAGARFDWTFRFGSELASDARAIHIDIEPDELGRNLPDGVRLATDAGRGLNTLVERLPARLESPDTNWLARLGRARRRRKAVWERTAASPSLPMPPQRLYTELRKVLPRDTVCVLDGNVCMAAGQQLLPARSPVSRYTAASNGCMGTGIPFAIGAKIADPTRPVVAVCGDFAFGLAALEMETAARHDVPVVVVVANNDGNGGAVRQRQFFPDHSERVSQFQSGLRYDLLAQALGVAGWHVDRPEQLGPAVRAALGSGRPACINVVLDPDATYPAPPAEVVSRVEDLA